MEKQLIITRERERDDCGTYLFEGMYLRVPHYGPCVAFIIADLIRIWVLVACFYSLSLSLSLSHSSADIISLGTLSIEVTTPTPLTLHSFPDPNLWAYTVNVLAVSSFIDSLLQGLFAATVTPSWHKLIKVYNCPSLCPSNNVIIAAPMSCPALLCVSPISQPT